MNIHDVKYLVVTFDETDGLDSDFSHDANVQAHNYLPTAQAEARRVATGGKPCVITQVTAVYVPSCNVTETIK